MLSQCDICLKSRSFVLAVRVYFRLLVIYCYRCAILFLIVSRCVFSPGVIQQTVGNRLFHKLCRIWALYHPRKYAIFGTENVSTWKFMLICKLKAVEVYTVCGTEHPRTWKRILSTKLNAQGLVSLHSCRKWKRLDLEVYTIVGIEN